MNSKKILIFSHEFPPFLGGVGKIAYEFCKMYSKCNNTSLITRREKKLTSVDGVSVFKVFTIPKIWFINYGFFYMKNKKIFDEADIIYLNEAAPTIVAGMFFSKEHLNKSIIIAHGLEVEGVLNNSSLLHKIFGIKRNYLKALRLSKKLITLSSHMKDKIVKSIPKYKEKIDYCYLGVDTKEFFYIEGAKEDFIVEENKNKKIVGSCSRIIFEKGYIEMANIMSQIMKKDKNIVWYIAGDGKDISGIKNHIQEIGIKNKVFFLGALSFKELRVFYSAIDMFMLLSNYDEVFPLVYTEAQLCGAIAIGRDRGGVKEVLDLDYGFRSNDDQEIVDFILSKENFNRARIINYTQNKFSLNVNFENWKNKVEP